MSSRRLTRAERQEQTRLALLDAAAEVVVERGFAGASVEAIVERAGFTRGAFYSNFSSKEELFAQLLERRLFVAYRELVARRAETPGELPPARQLGEELAAVQADPDGRWLFRLWLELLAHIGREPQLRYLAADFWRGHRRLIAQVVEAAERKGEITLAGYPAERVATAFIAVDLGLAIQHYMDPGDVPLEVYPEAFEALFDRYHSGLQSRRASAGASEEPGPAAGRSRRAR